MSARPASDRIDESESACVGAGVVLPTRRTTLASNRGSTYGRLLWCSPCHHRQRCRSSAANVSQEPHIGRSPSQIYPDRAAPVIGGRVADGIATCRDACVPAPPARRIAEPLPGQVRETPDPWLLEEVISDRQGRATRTTDHRNRCLVWTVSASAHTARPPRRASSTANGRSMPLPTSTTRAPVT